jgi:SecD/SecF fusion protein
MGGRRRNLFVLLFVLGLLVASVAVIAGKKTRLGLDLQGGIELVLQGRPTPQQPTVDASAINRAIDQIRNGCDQLGVSEIEVSRLGTDQISVGIPGATSLGKATECATKPARLNFYDWEANVIGKKGSPQPAEDAFTNLYDAVKLASVQKPTCQRCTTDARYYLFKDDRLHTRISGPETVRSDLYLRTNGRKRPHTGTVLKVPKGTLVVTDTPSADPGVCASRDCFFVLHDKSALSGSDIKSPQQTYDPQTQEPIVSFNFTGTGQKEFQDVTRQIAQRGAANALPGQDPAISSNHFAIILDNAVVSRPIINYQENPDGIDGRNGAQISGINNLGKAQTLAEFLKRGALQIDLKLISQSQVSATLGKQALDEGLRAGIAGLLIVIIFLLILYRFLGLIASIALGAYGVIFFALIKLIPITLTLPGIAGLILTIGVAADSNIVIFERIKEEVRAGRSMAAAISAGYRRGIATIVDANVVTLLTAFILFVLATSGVQGFALTLAIGTLTSLLTAVVFTQALLSTMSHSRFLRSPAALGAGPQRVRWHFDFMGASRWFFSISGVILAVGAIALATKQLNLGIDFESGTRITVSVQKSTDETGVRDALSPLGLSDAEIQAVNNPGLGPNSFEIKSGQLGPGKIASVQSTLQKEFGITPNGFDNTSVGPTFGSTVASNAGKAIIFSLLLITGYVALRFDPKFALPVLIALFHDILITAGVYSLTSREVSSATVAAFLTILGYSLYDTIIVFDRVRENLPRMPRAAFSQIVNRSMSEVLTRSLATSFSTLLPISALLLFGGETLKDFAFALLVGVASGTYSSIFIASPVLTAWKEREPNFRARRARIEQAMGTVPPFAEEIEVAKLPELEEEDSEAEAPEPAKALTPASHEAGRRSQEEILREAGIVDEAPAGDGGGADAGEEPAVGAASDAESSESRDRQSSKRRQRQRRRKHGRRR